MSKFSTNPVGRASVEGPSFIRAFRREFGITPGEAREWSLRSANAPPDDHLAEPQPETESARWVAQLTGAMPQLSTLRAERKP